MGGPGHTVPAVFGVLGITVAGVAGLPGMIVGGIPGAPGITVSGVPGEPGMTVSDVPGVPGVGTHRVDDFVAVNCSGLDRLTALTHAAGATTLIANQYEYDSANNIRNWTNASGGHDYEYDPVNRLLAATNNLDPENYSNDEVGNRTKSHLGGYAYDPFNKLIPTDTAGYTYDSNGNLLSENKFGVTTQFTYTAEGDIATKRDARGNTITYSQYKQGIPQSEVHPESVTIARVVDNAGNVTSQTDGEGAVTTYAFDGLNRLKAIVHPTGNPVSITWGQNSRVVQRAPYREFTTFDAYGRTVSVQLDGGASGSIVQTSQYDPVNRKIFSSYFNQAAGTLYQYDPLGRIFSTSNVAKPAPSGLFTVAGGSRTSRFAFSTVQNTNERGLTYEMDYRGYGDPDHLDLLQIIAPDPAANVVFTRNGLGQPLTVQQAGQTRSNVYDASYFLTQASNPETGTTLYGRDEVGNMISRQVGNSGITPYSYDGRNRLVSSCQRISSVQSCWISTRVVC